VINQTMAAQHWPNQDPIGKGFKWGGRHLTVIGVVGDLHIQALDKLVGPAVYNSIYQVETGATTSAVLVIRTPGEQDPMQLAAAAQNVIWSVDHGLPILGFSTLHQVVSASIAARRASLALAGGFAVLAVLLSLIGVYGVLSYAITQRTREMGVRLALGADPREIMRLVVADGLRMAGWGITLGLAGAALSGTLIAKLLFGVHSLDPISYVAGVAMLIGVCLVASYIPARRAARVDPIMALRYE